MDIQQIVAAWTTDENIKQMIVQRLLGEDLNEPRFLLMLDKDAVRRLFPDLKIMQQLSLLAHFRASLSRLPPAYDLAINAHTLTNALRLSSPNEPVLKKIGSGLSTYFERLRVSQLVVSYEICRLAPALIPEACWKEWASVIVENFPGESLEQYFYQKDDHEATGFLVQKYEQLRCQRERWLDQQHKKKRTPKHTCRT